MADEVEVLLARVDRDAKNIADLGHSLALAYRQVDNMASVLRQVIAAHEDVDSGADIPVHIYKLAKAACPPRERGRHNEYRNSYVRKADLL